MINFWNLLFDGGGPKGWRAQKGGGPNPENVGDPKGEGPEGWGPKGRGPKGGGGASEVGAQTQKKLGGRAKGGGPKGVRAQRGGGPNREKVWEQREGARRVEARSVSCPTFRAIFSLSRTHLRIFFFSRRVFRWNCGRWLGPRTSQIVCLGFYGVILCDGGGPGGGGPGGRGPGGGGFGWGGPGGCDFGGGGFGGGGSGWDQNFAFFVFLSQPSFLISVVLIKKTKRWSREEQKA